MPHEPVDPKLAGQVPPETAIYSVPYPRGNRLTRRFVPLAIWVPPALAACAQAIRAENPDAVLTSSPPHMIHLLGRLLKARFGLPWIADYRAPWVHGLGILPSRDWHIRWKVLQERIVLRTADTIVVNTPLARDALARDAPQYAFKMRAITNGFDPENFVSNNAAVEQRSTLSILHTGELYSGRDPRPLFDVLRGLEVSDSETSGGHVSGAIFGPTV